MQLLIAVPTGRSLMSVRRSRTILSSGAAWASDQSTLGDASPLDIDAVTYGAVGSIGAMTSSTDAPTSPPTASQASTARAPIKPKLRGWLHAGMFPAVARRRSGAHRPRRQHARAASPAPSSPSPPACCSASSALYHRGNWGPRGDGDPAPARPRQHLPDHRGHLHAAHDAAAARRQAAARCCGWSGRGALAGIAFRVFWVGAPRWLYTPCYIALGWAAVFFLPDFLRTGGIAVLVLVIVGGAALQRGRA